ncbi:MAG: hypothetical protein HW386_526 [Gammaproteobacteria bacterium]|nr:hypothetical protein [Gammaproteobacteria bacterium]
MKQKRREAEVFSISFLDVITCGFGAIILILMIARTGTPVILEASDQNLEGTVRDLQEKLFQIRGESTILNRDLTSRQEQLSNWDERIARLNSDLASLYEQLAKLQEEKSVNSAVAGELEAALQQMTEEMQRLLSQRNEQKTDFVGGIPVDSEYIIFIIDTSGSMFQYAWEKMTDQLVTTLNVYPTVKGIQIMSDEGEYMFPQYRGKWMPDTPGRRQVIINRIRTWNPFSNSSPVEGITKAIKTYYSPDIKISLYVYGDDFMAGRSIKEVLDTVDRINPKDADGNPAVRIHAVGFPQLFENPVQYQGTVIRFAHLMRELAQRNGGTFVGLNEFRF